MAKLCIGLAHIKEKQKMERKAKAEAEAAQAQQRAREAATADKVHTRGNTDWDIDGRNVRITLPGKHHDFLTELKSVSDSTNEETTDFVDSATGLTYSTIKKSVYQRLINRAFIKKEEIEIRNAA